jgi:hypothetical protein
LAYGRWLGVDTVTFTRDARLGCPGVLENGVRLAPASVALADRWYTGYFRAATNEEGVVRSYLSTGDASFGREIEQRTRGLLEREFGGRVVD